MRMSKIEGLKMLKILDFPTVELIDPKLLDENSQILKQGLSVRTSPKKDLKDNTDLPSIHNCKDLNELRTFINEHKNEYYIIVHKTAQPEQIGSVSRYENYANPELIIEIFEDFDKRENGIIKNRFILPIRGERFMVSQLEMKEKNAQEYKVFSQVLRDIKYIPFKQYDLEFVVEDAKILFTDLTIKGKEDNEYAEELRNKTQQKEEKREYLEK